MYMYTHHIKIIISFISDKKELSLCSIPLRNFSINAVYETLRTLRTHITPLYFSFEPFFILYSKCFSSLWIKSSYLWIYIQKKYSNALLF